MKRILCLLTIATLCVAGRSYVMADEIDDKNLLNGGTIIPQSVEAEYEYGDKDNLTHEYVWKDDMKVATYAAASESEQLSYASWQEHKEADGTLNIGQPRYHLILAQVRGMLVHKRSTRRHIFKM